MEDADISRSWFLEQLVGQDHEAYERLTNMAKQARANEAQFLEHLILRADAIYNFQPPVLPPPRPWWKLWSKEERGNFATRNSDKLCQNLADHLTVFVTDPAIPQKH